MAVKRSRPGVNTVRSNEKVGPSYAEDRFEHPWNAEIGFPFGTERDDKAVMSEAGSTFDPVEIGLTKGEYNKLWEGK